MSVKRLASYSIYYKFKMAPTAILYLSEAVSGDTGVFRTIISTFRSNLVKFS